MSESVDEFQAYCTLIEERVAEAIARHRKAVPDVPLARVMEREIQNEMDRLDAILRSDATDPEVAAALQSVKTEWLPFLRSKLRRRFS